MIWSWYMNGVLNEEGKRSSVGYIVLEIVWSRFAV
jgi:hypothetical protein